MTDDDPCCSRPEADNAVYEVPPQGIQRPTHDAYVCPDCGKKAKPVQGQTIKAMLAVSLRVVQGVDFFFCRTQTCPVVYFSSDGQQTFVKDQIRERVYQKESEADEVFICYCFRHTVGSVRTASPESQTAILDDINLGINAGQCACDLRNPQGDCCLGNVRSLIKQLDRHAPPIPH